MAAHNQNFMFGDFDDLAPDEHQRIQNILHGYKEPTQKKVEFPWDDSSYEGATAGPDVYYADAGLEFGFTPEYSGTVEGAPQEQAVNWADQYPEEFARENNNVQRHDNDQVYNQYDNFGSGDSTPVNSPNPSKLQASLKTYERRNKKKRPPGYYSQSGTEGYSGDPNVLSTNEHSVVHAEVVVGLNSQTDATNYSEIKQDNFVDPYVNMTDTAGVHHYNAVPAYQNIENVQCIQGAPGVNTQNGAIHAQVYNGAQYGDARIGELNEVVVESVPYSNTHGQQELDTKQIQDHDRTTTNNQYVSDVKNSNNYMHTSSVASDNNNQVYVSKLQIPNLSAPNRDNAQASEGVEYSTNSSQMSESFQPVCQASETIPSNEVSSDMQIPSIGSKNSSDKNELPDANVVETDSSSASVNSSETTAKDIVKTDIDAPVTEAESPKPNPTPAPAPAPAKPTSWAGLFKSSGSSSYSQPIVAAPSVDNYPKGDNPDNRTEEERSEREVSPLPVPATEDKEARQLGELLSKMTISHSSVALQPRGLVNRANWCYINGTLQALVACPPFYNLLKKLPRYPALSRGPSSTPILDSLVEFAHEFHPMLRNMDKGQKKGVRDINPGSPFEPSYVYKMLQIIQVNPHFKHGKQEDAEEFLSCILDGIHEEMSAAVALINKNDKTEPIQDGYTNGYAAGETSEDEESELDAWEQVGPKKKSVQTRRSDFAKTPIADIFAGMLRSVVYKASAKETATLQPFFTLQLDIQSEKVWSVRDALEGFVSKEPISGYTCAKTNTEVEVVKKLSLEELPPVLILHLKFFVYNKDGGTQKLLKKVDFPVELEITKDLLSPNARNKLNQQQRSYKLFAVVYHHGKTTTGGHYTSSVFHPGINGWIHSDDSTVKTVLVRDVLKYVPQRVPYLLYYRRLDSH